MEYYEVIKKTIGLPAHTTTWINFKSPMLSSQSQIPDHTLYDSTYIKHQKRHNSSNRIQFSCQEPKGGRRRRLTTKDEKKLVK